MKLGSKVLAFLTVLLMVIGNFNIMPALACNESDAGKISIHKVDSVTGGNLAGAVFKIQQKGSNSSWSDTGNTMTTDSQGTATSGWLYPGTYRVVETTAPSGYLLDQTPSAEITITTAQYGQTVALPGNIKDVPNKGKIKLVKIDADQTSKLLPGAVFDIYKTNTSSGNRVAQGLTTGGDGTITSDLLPVRTDYIAVETSAPGGYQLNATPIYNIAVTAGGVTTVSFGDTRSKGKIRITKYVDGCLSSYAGDKTFTFKIVNKDTGETFTGSVTGEQTCEISNVPYGTYMLTETNVPQGFAFNSFKVNGTAVTELTLNDVSKDVTCYNDKKASIRITKDDGNGKLLSGAQFKLYRKDGSAWVQVGGIYTSNANGECVIAGLDFGTYKVEEVSAPFGYSASSTDPGTKDLDVINETETFAFHNCQKLGSIKVVKAVNKDPNDTGVIPNFTVRIVGPSDNANVAGTTKDYTISVGSNTISNLPYGSYTISEVSIPNGFDQDYTISSSTFAISDSHANDIVVNITNTKLNGKIIVTKKLADGQSDPTATFTFTLTCPDGSVKHSTAIHAGETYTFSALEYGSYTISEDTAAGFTPVFSGDISGATIVVNSATARNVTCTNTKHFGSIAVLKKLADGQTDPTATFTFTLTCPDGSVKHSTAIHANETYTFTGLAYGSYTLVEDTAIGFTPVFSGDITNGGVVINSETVKNVTCTNTKNFGSITVTKKITGATPADGTTFTFSLWEGATKKDEKVLTWGQNNNKVTFGNLEFGHTYIVKEAAKDGYTIDTNFVAGVSKTITVADPNPCIDCTNTVLYGSITVTKKITGATPADGTTFTFSLWEGATKKDEKVLTWGQNSNKVTFANLEFGHTYIVKEAAKDGYTIDTNFVAGVSKTITMADPNPCIDCTNTVLCGNITITKKFANNESPAAPTAFTFKLWKDGAIVDTKQLNWSVTSNTLSFTGLVFGATYYVTEDDTAGYKADPLYTGTGYKVVIGENNKLSFAIDCTNTAKRGSITVTKQLAAGQSDPNATFTFTLTGPDSSVRHSTAIHAGEVYTFTGLAFGSYTLVEDTATGYTPVFSGDISGNTVVVNSEEAKNVTCTNTKHFGSIAVTKQLAAGQSDPNATFTFTLTGPDSSVKHSTAIHAGEVYTFTGLAYGSYTLSEDSVLGYTALFSGDISGNNTVVVDSETTKNVTCTNTKHFGSIAVTKQLAAGQSDPTATFTFTLTGPDSSVKHSTAIHAGEVYTFTGLAYGSYTLVEDTATGYTPVFSGDIIGNTVVISSDVVKNVTCTNTKHFGSIAVTKQLAAGQSDPNATFTFTLTGPDSSVKHSTAIHAGEVYTFTGLAYGSYTLVEDTAAGYTPVFSGDIAGNTVVISSDVVKNVTCTNTKLYGSITVTKKFAGAVPANGTTFTFTLWEGAAKIGNDLVLTWGQNNNQATFASPGYPLQYGHTYTVKETAQAGFAIDPTYVNGVSVTIQSANIAIDCTNQQLGRLQLTKRDSSNPNLYLGGATFRVISVANPSLIFQLTTSQSGTVTSDWLVPGDYTVQEIGAPAGYHIDDPSARTVTVYPGSTTSSGATVFTDSMGSVLVKKLSSYGNTPVDGVKFQLLRNPPKADGSINNGDVVGESTTNISGLAWFYGLPVGTDYWVREIQQAPGYDIDRTIVYKVTSSYNPVVAAATFVNNPVGKVSITKYDASTVHGNDYTNSTKLEGAVYGIYANTDYTKAPVATITTSKDGAVQSAELPFGGSNPGSYYVKEITAPAGYVLSNDVQIVTFSAPGQVVELAFTDLQNIGSIVIKKVDALNPDQPLAGAEFTLYSDAALTKQVGAAVTTGDDGLAIFTNLQLGNYWIMETKAPKDYDLLTAPIPVTVYGGGVAPAPLIVTDQYNPPHDIQTGTMDWNILLIGGLALLAGGLMVFLTRKRRTGAKR